MEFLHIVGSVASVLGAVAAVLAWLSARSARQAAEAARRSVLGVTLVDELARLVDGLDVLESLARGGDVGGMRMNADGLRRDVGQLVARRGHMLSSRDRGDLARVREYLRLVGAADVAPELPGADAPDILRRLGRVADLLTTVQGHAQRQADENAAEEGTS